MPLKMMMMCKKYIITLQTSNYKLNKSVSMADCLIYKAVIKKSIWPDIVFLNLCLLVAT